MLSAFCEAAQQADLAGVVNVVESDSIEHGQAPFGFPRFEDFANGFEHGLVFVRQDGAVGAPVGFGRLPFFRPCEEIAPFEDKAAALSSVESLTHRIFPVGSVEG